MKFIPPLEVQKLVANNNATLIDIREKYERDICKVCKIEGVHIPMAEVPYKINELTEENQFILMCKTGKRAEALGNVLEVDYNFTNIAVMENGIMGWIAEVESNLESY